MNDNKTANMSKIESIIEDYCEGNYHLEFSRDNLPAMAEEIKKLLIEEIKDSAEHVNDAVRCVESF